MTHADPPDPGPPRPAAPPPAPPPVAGPPQLLHPPPGPGVRPPFVAAPIEGRRARLGLSLGLAGGLLAACCGVGGVAVGGLVLLGEQALNEQAQRAVDDYLAAVAEQEWQEAYEQRCAADREAESLREFTDRISDRPRIEEYSLGDLRIETGDDPLGVDGEMSVPADISYADGTDTVLEIPVDQNPETGQFEVCDAATG